MTNTDLYSRYIWLIELIYRCDGISRAQINAAWAQSHLNVLGETEIPERTFHRYKIAIKQLFGIEIHSSRKEVSSYHIHSRWFLVGRNVSTGCVATYSMALVRSLRCTDRTFVLPADFNAATYPVADDCEA